MRYAALLGVLLGILSLSAAEPDAAALFEKNCQLCHKPDSPTRAPLPAVLKTMPVARILTSLESGSMKAQAESLTTVERAALARYLGAPSNSISMPLVNATSSDFNRCPTPMPPFAKLAGWNGWSPSPTNSRLTSASGLRPADIPKLKLKWAFAFPNTVAAFGQPTVVDNRIFVGSDKGGVFALDARTGCQYWNFKADGTVRTAITVARRKKDNRIAAYFGDTRANAYAVDASTGELIWKRKLDDHPMARITGSPTLFENRLYVPMASGVEEMAAANPKYECCKFRGSLSALDADSGEVIWKSYTIPDPPKPTRVNSSGTQLYGPAGATIWLSPTIDAKRRVVYVGTGNDYTEPATPYSDSVIAFSLATGERKWVRQLHPGDAWNGSCLNPARISCPAESGPDVDIGASPVLAANGKFLIVGQKNGLVHALDPDSDGKVIWQTRIGKGGMLGGVQWGLAADATHAYVALSDFEGGMDRRQPLPTPGGLFALDLATGSKSWATIPPKPDCAGTPGGSSAQMSAVTLMPGLAFAGAMDGTLRAYETKTGKIVWETNTRQPFTTVNGVTGKGGSLSGGGATLAGGMLFVNSGYGALGGMAGNVLLAFGL